MLTRPELPAIQWVPALGEMRVNPWLYLGVPLAFVFANYFEWRIHRGPLHRPGWPRILYKRSPSSAAYMPGPATAPGLSKRPGGLTIRPFGPM